MEPRPGGLNTTTLRGGAHEHLCLRYVLLPMSPGRTPPLETDCVAEDAVAPNLVWRLRFPC
jgi:hypothetical protein